MIVKMKFVNISGPRNDIDRVTDLYLSRYEIQLESALSELKTVDNLRPFMEINPYRDVLKKRRNMSGIFPMRKVWSRIHPWALTICLRWCGRQEKTISLCRRKRKIKKTQR